MKVLIIDKPPYYDGMKCYKHHTPMMPISPSEAICPRCEGERMAKESAKKLKLNLSV